MLNKLEDLRGKSGLKNAVIDYITDHFQDDEEITSFLEDLLQHGCQSGMVGSLIYYHDTVKFYNEHQREIDALLKETMEETGIYSPVELFGNKWDEEDPLAREQMNQNLLAWFGFEETARKVAWDLELDI